MIEDLLLKISHASDPELKHFLQQKIREFNNRVSPFHLEVRKEGAIKPVNLTFKDKQKNVIAGINAEMYWGWLDISFVWVAEAYRHQGIGTVLLNKVEKEAKNNGCDKVRLTTFSFQAKDFYIKHGYSVVGQLNDYPPGNTYYLMTKQL